jgi:hypothetical protein
LKVETMRKLLLAAAGAALVGLGAPSAQAQEFSITIGTPGYYGPPAYRPYSVYRSHPVYEPAYRRPVRAYRPYPVYAQPVYYGPACTTRVTRYWDGRGWVSRRERLCD